MLKDKIYVFLLTKMILQRFYNGLALFKVEAVVMLHVLYICNVNILKVYTE